MEEAEVKKLNYEIMLLTEREQNQTNAFLATLGRQQPPPSTTIPPPSSLSSQTQKNNVDDSGAWRRPSDPDLAFPSHSSSSFQQEPHASNNGADEDISNNSDYEPMPLNKSHLQSSTKSPPFTSPPPSAPLSQATRAPTPTPPGNPAPYPQHIYKTRTPTPTQRPPSTTLPSHPSSSSTHPAVAYQPNNKSTARDYAKPNNNFPQPLYSTPATNSQQYAYKQPYQQYTQVSVLHDEIERLQQRIMDRLHSPYPT